MQAANPAMGLLAQADDGNCGCATWVNAMHTAVPEPGDHGRRLDRPPLRPEEPLGAPHRSAHRPDGRLGWSSSIPIDITEYGMATDNGRTLTDNYDWPTNQTYQQAADAVTLTVNQMLAKPGFGSRLRLFTYFQGHDQQASGSSNEREYYFGVMKSDGSRQGCAHHDPGVHRRRTPRSLIGLLAMGR